MAAFASPHARVQAFAKAKRDEEMTGKFGVDAVRKWQYKPETLDGQPVASGINVTIFLSLPE